MFHITICDDLQLGPRALKTLLTELIAQRPLQAAFTKYNTARPWQQPLWSRDSLSKPTNKVRPLI